MQIRASHILCQEEETVRNLHRQLTEGADFSTLAKEHSMCPSKLNGGDLGMFTEGMMVKPFEDASFALQVGQLSEPIQTNFGWHLIHRTA
jgi:hypothetical protein